MTRFAISILVASILSVSTHAADPGDAVVESIIANGHRNVAVLPTVVIRKGDAENTIGSLGPRGRLMAEELYRKLMNAAQLNGRRFRVVPERVVRRAMAKTKFKVEDLGDPKAIRSLAREAGADTLVTLTKDEDKDRLEAEMLFAGSDGEGGSDGEATAKRDNGPKAKVLVDKIKAEVLDTEDTFATFDADFEDHLTLSKAAYAGESWELRRWMDGKLVNVGMDLDGNKAFGQGTRWEKYQFASLQTSLQHPLDIADLPFHVGIFVDNKERPLIPFMDDKGMKQYVVALDPGEVYSIGLDNKYNDHAVHVALYVDGVNTIDRVRREPADLELLRHWYLPAQSGRRTIRGWYNVQKDDGGFATGRGNEYSFNEFEILPRDESVAYGAGFEDNIGQITAIFYAHGTEGIDQPSDDELPLASRGLPTAQFGTGLGKLKDQKLNRYTTKPLGPILAAITIHYRTTEALESLEKGETRDPRLAKLEDPRSGRDPDNPTQPGQKKSESDLPGNKGPGDSNTTKTNARNSETALPKKER